MKSFIASGILLSACILAAGVRADDMQWRPSGSASPSAATSGAWNSANSAAAKPSAPIVTLSRPVPIHSTAKTADPGIKPVSLFEAAPISRVAADEVRSADPLQLTPTPTMVKPAPGMEEIPVQPRQVSTSQTTGSFFGGPPVLDDGSCGACNAPCCGAFTDGCCPPRGRFWASAEYLYWGVKSASVPPLLTTSPTGTPLATAGILGEPTTTVLFDKNSLTGDMRSGGRFTLGFWIPGWDGLGIEASYFFLGQISSNYFIQSSGSPILMRPFTEASTNTPLAIPTAFPGVVAGSFDVHTSSYLWGAEINARQKLFCGCWGYVDLLAGYRFFQLQDSINMVDVEQPLIGPPGQPAFNVTDSFFTRNTFNGGQIGIDGQWNFWRRFWLGATAKVAIGDVHQTVTVNGFTTGAANLPFGVLALPSNIGTFSRDHFGVLPAGTLKIGYNFTPRWRVWIGYDFLYLNSVVRAGDQIDLSLNHNLLPGGTGLGPVQPIVPFHATSFWAQGASFGLEYRW